MESVLTYVLQVNLLLAIVFLGYMLLLKGLTFYSLNRVYLLIGGLYSLVYPFLDIASWFRGTEGLSIGVMWEYVEYYLPEQIVEVFSVGHLLLVVLGIGAVVLLFKLSIQLLSLMRIHRYSKLSRWKDYFFRNVMFPIVPFSFFNKIYVHQDQHDDSELYDIFKHEDIHVKGLHTVDILLFEVLLIGCWYNPFVWLMRRAVRQNLEFLTDQQVLDKGVDRQAYQYSLLTVTKQGVAVGVGNQFNFKTFKKRIMMMNKKRSSKIELSKYAFLLPVLLLVGASFTASKADDKIEELVERIKEVPVDVVLPKVVVQQLTYSKDTIRQQKAERSAMSDSTVSTSGAIVQGDIAGLLTGSALNVVSRREVEPLLFVDGLRYYGNIAQLNPNDIESINVFKGEQAIALYGDKAKDGVVLVKAKEGTVTQRLYGKPPVSIGRDTVKAGLGQVMIRGVNTLYGENEPPLFVVDGNVVRNSHAVNSISPDNIESMSIIKNKAAVSLYGEKAKNGVISVTTKKGRTDTESDKPIEEGVSYKNTSTIKNGGNVLSITEGGILMKPLVVIDGKIQPSGFDLKLLDVSGLESVVVLKDEQATAAYGELGKDGVIKVVTKKGSN